MQRDSLAQRAWYHGYQGYRGVSTYRVSGTKDSTIWHNRLRIIAVFNCFYLFSRFKNLGGDMRTNIKENNPIEKVLNNGSKFDS